MAGISEHPIIIIGIGSSGLHVLDQVQRAHYEAFRTNKPKNVEYLYIETNKDNREEVTPLPSAISRVYISLSQMDVMVRNLKAETDHPWLPEERQLLNAGLGAGGIRPCGRLALWGRNEEGDNFRNVIEAITQAFARAVKDSSHKKPTVFMVGSSTGGTGSGIFIDIAYLIRSIISDIKELFGVFMIPQKPKVILNHEVIYANTYAMLRDLHYYNHEDTTYEIKWPNGMNASFPHPPFELVQVVSQDYSDGSPSINNLSGLFQMVGMYLFLNISGLRDKRMERLVDAAGNSHIGKYGTFGLSAIQFPKEQIQEYLATQLGIQLLERWTDANNYYYNNKPYPINKASIQAQAKDQWDKIITKAFATLDQLPGQNLITRLEEEAELISRKDQKGEPLKYLTDLYTSHSADNLYAMVRNQVPMAVSSLVEGIHDWLNDELNQTENLSYVHMLLDQMVEAIRETVVYWNNDLKITQQENSWEKLLKEQTQWMYKGGMVLSRYREVGLGKVTLNDRMNTTFDLMKIHLLEGKVREIARNIRKEDLDYQSSHNPNKRLPRLSEIREIERLVKKTIGKDVGLEESTSTNDGAMNLVRRLSQISLNVQDESLPIYRVYKAGSFKEEVEVANRLFQQKNNNAVSTKRTVIQDKDLWSYLKSLGYTFERDLYNDVIRRHSELVADSECVPDYDVADFIKNTPSEGQRFAERAIAAMLRVGNDVVFGRSPYIPRYVIGADKAKIREIIQLFRGKLNFNEFESDTSAILEIPDLKNILVFYDEKGNFSPLQDLSYTREMREIYEKYPVHLREMTDEKWARDRKAYTTDDKPEVFQSLLDAKK